jgi:hypothetical protein
MLDILQDGLQIGLQLDNNKDERYHPNRYLILNDDTTTVTPALIPPADMFVFISETCLPIQPLSYWSAQLDATVSYVNARQCTNKCNMYESQQFSQIRLMPHDCRWKADQWLALCRSHALAVLNIDNHLPEEERLWRRAIKQVRTSEEMYFPTALAILQLLKPDVSNDSGGNYNNSSTKKITSKSNSLINKENDRATAASVSPPIPTSMVATSLTTTTTPNVPAPAAAVVAAVEKRAVTYTDWPHGMWDPTSFTTKDLLDVTKTARTQGCLLARQFTGVVDVADWQRCCNNN